MRRWFRRRREPAPCPIRALCDELKAQGWIAVPFPIPDACHGRTCGHTRFDVHVMTYAQLGRSIARAVEDGWIGDAGTVAIEWPKLRTDGGQASEQGRNATS